MCPSITVFGKEFSVYALLSVAGFLLAGTLAWWMTRLTWKFYKENTQRGLTSKRPVSADTLLTATLPALIGVIIGATTLYTMTNIPDMIDYLTNDWGRIVASEGEFAAFMGLGNYFGGIVFYGGLLGGMAGAWWYSKRARFNLGEHLDVVAPAIPLFHAFGRLGCFASGCCYGIECSWGFYHEHALVAQANGAVRFPVQLLEAGLNLLLCTAIYVLFYFFWQKWRAGSFIRIYFAAYALIRFFDEFLRGDTYRGIWLGLSTSQWISLGILVFLIVTHNRWLENNPKPVEAAIIMDADEEYSEESVSAQTVAE